MERKMKESIFPSQCFHQRPHKDWIPETTPLTCFISKFLITTYIMVMFSTKPVLRDHRKTQIRGFRARLYLPWILTVPWTVYTSSGLALSTSRLASLISTTNNDTQPFLSQTSVNHCWHSMTIHSLWTVADQIIKFALAFATFVQCWQRAASRRCTGAYMSIWLYSYSCADMYIHSSAYV